jgi:hypothetical protein
MFKEKEDVSGYRTLAHMGCILYPAFMRPPVEGCIPPEF